MAKSSTIHRIVVVEKTQGQLRVQKRVKKEDASGQKKADDSDFPNKYSEAGAFSKRGRTCSHGQHERKSLKGST